MDIMKIQNPAFLKDLNDKALCELTDDIRAFLIETISHTGGHLSSNLGVVDLTVAIHYVFNAPKDKILFDVGHQCYTHKILTGRINRMHTIRQFNGLSGFQKRYESEYDCFEAGHSSTSLSHAFGMAVARDLNGDDYEVIDVIGDGALNSGLSLEALNSIGYEKKKVIIVFNDNNMSISKNVGALSLSFARLRNSDPYNRLKADIKGILGGSSYGKSTIKAIHNIKNAIKDKVIDAGIFHEFNINYLGPVDGHNLHDLIQAFEAAKACDGPVVVHCVTKKGYGYKYAQEDLTGRWHGVDKFNVATGEMLSKTPEGYVSYSKLVADTVEEIMARNEDVVTITPAMIGGSALQSIFQHYPERSFDVGIAEEHAVAFASGLALNGKRPFAAIYSSFLQRAYDQINHDVCRMDLPVVFGIDRAGLVGEDGETHHGVFDISFLRAIPNIIITQGKNAREIRSLLNLGFSQNHPFATRYPRGILKLPEHSDFDEIVIGKWEKVVDRADAKAVILSYGPDVETIESDIRNNDMPYNLINCRFLKPMDYELLDELGASGLPLYLYTNDMIKGGLGEEIALYLNNNHYSNPLTVFGIDDIYVKHGSIAQLHDYLKLDLKSLYNCIGND